MINANFNKRKRSIFLKLENRSYAQQFTVNCKPNCTVRTIKLMNFILTFLSICCHCLCWFQYSKHTYNLCHQIEKPFKRGERWCVHYWFLATNSYISFTVWMRLCYFLKVKISFPFSIWIISIFYWMFVFFTAPHIPSFAFRVHFAFLTQNWNIFFFHFYRTCKSIPVKIYYSWSLYLAYRAFVSQIFFCCLLVLNTWCELRLSTGRKVNNRTVNKSDKIKHISEVRNVIFDVEWNAPA